MDCSRRIIVYQGIARQRRGIVQSLAILAAHGFCCDTTLDDYSKWQFEDIGGLHVMASLPREDFLEILVPPLNLVEAYHNGGFMVDLIARGRH
jgi:hypothetical protein